MNNILTLKFIISIYVLAVLGLILMLNGESTQNLLKQHIRIEEEKHETKSDLDLFNTCLRKIKDPPRVSECKLDVEDMSGGDQAKFNRQFTTFTTCVDDVFINTSNINMESIQKCYTYDQFTGGSKVAWKCFKKVYDRCAQYYKHIG